MLPGEDPAAYARLLARQKAEDVASRHPGRIVLGADTVVTVDGLSLAKPADASDAVRMLRVLRGRTHTVVTGVALCGRGKDGGGAVAARVSMRQYSDDEIERYVATGEPMDKAGAYAVQGLGGALVERVVGCYPTVVGLPLCLTMALLRHCGLGTCVIPGARCDHRNCRP